jgi:hypothetical protein
VKIIFFFYTNIRDGYQNQDPVGTTGQSQSTAFQQPTCGILCSSLSGCPPLALLPNVQGSEHRLSRLS